MYTASVLEHHLIFAMPKSVYVKNEDLNRQLACNLCSFWFIYLYLP